jgi:AcrR family transcriptional regulator
MEEQRQKFCEAAMACFRRKGVVATNLTDICEETGLSMGALYKFFGSREDLLEGVLRQLLARRNELLQGRSWVELRAALLRYKEERAANPFWAEFQGVVDWNERLLAVRVAQGREVLGLLQRHVEAYAAAGEISPPLNARRTAQLLSIVIDGSLVDARAAKDLKVSAQDLGAYLDLAVGFTAPARKR